MNIIVEIKKGLEQALKELGAEAKVEVVIPNDLSKGDFTSNIAMRLGGKLGAPMEAGEKIVEKIRGQEILFKKFGKIELVNPGFINFYLSSEIVSQALKDSLRGFKAEKRGIQIMEFGDLNPFKEPHIGHIRNFALGESLSRLFEFTGIEVNRLNYEGDVGMHVAKAIYGIQKSGEFEKVSSEDLEARAKYLGKCYAIGAKAFEEDENAKKEIVLINTKVYQKDPQVVEIWEKGRAWSLEYFEGLYKRLGVKYEKYYFESEIAEHGKQTVIGHPNVFEKDNDAYIFRGEKYGLHTRVFVNNQGNPTYEAKDLGLAFAKEKDFPMAEKSIIMTANEQTEYFKVLIKALGEIDEKIAGKTQHLSYGFVDLKEGKMSSRSGNVVSGFWLLDETRKRIKEQFRDVPEVVLEDISIGAVKWSMLKFSRTSDIKFSIEESIDLAGNSGPYMQYTYARIMSILGKAPNTDFEAISVKTFGPEMLALGRLVCQFDSNIKSASDTYSPNILTDYLFTLAQNFNAFYEKERILGTEDEKEKLMICLSLKNVIGQGLNLLGINTPEKI